MTVQSPPTLLELAGRSLLSDKSRAVLGLEDLPIELFPPLFVEAISRGHTEVLKKMVQAWPFTRLPLGALMRKPQLEMTQGVLEGRWKLQVLDLRNVPQNFWRMWSGAVVDACSPEDIKKNRTLKLSPAMAAKPPFKVFVDLSLRKRPLDEFLTHLFLWVYVPTYTSQEEQEQLLAQLTSQFLRMDCLRKFCANAVFLLEGHLEQVLRHLKTPLETLSITNCPLSDSDWKYLSRYPNARQLRHLELRGIKLTDFSLEPLQILLDSTATTLNSLDLAACGITDSQLQALLPALSRCSQLVILSIHGNRLSMSTLSDLLLHTARLSQLSVELYPAPLESYDAWGTIHPGRCSQLCAELTAIVLMEKEGMGYLVNNEVQPQEVKGHVVPGGRLDGGGVSSKDLASKVPHPTLTPTHTPTSPEATEAQAPGLRRKAEAP
ncbi:PRAME family member 20-like [Urocitellus parryii]